MVHSEHNMDWRLGIRLHKIKANIRRQSSRVLVRYQRILRFFW